MEISDFLCNGRAFQRCEDRYLNDTEHNGDEDEFEDNEDNDTEEVHD